MARCFWILGLLIFWGCYRAPEVDNFNTDSWVTAIEKCNKYRVNAANVLIQQQDKLLSKNQNEITALLGTPEKHELSDRNQKFFLYQLNCEDSLVLSLRFDALGRVKEITLLQNQK